MRNEIALPFGGNILASGDSKTNANPGWPLELCTLLEAQEGTDWNEQPNRISDGGWKISNLRTYLETTAVGPGIPGYILMNFGANDAAVTLNESQFKTDYAYCIDFFRARWSGVKIYLAKAWRRNYETECDTLADWIDDIVASYPSNVFVGHDERIWMENGDDGSTYTTDGVHYNAAGTTKCAQEWKTVIGY